MIEDEQLLVYMNFECEFTTISSALQSRAPRAFGILKKKVFMLMTLNVPEESQRNMGIAGSLLHILAHLLNANGYERIDVDDMSSRFRMPHNIYLKYGFNYCHETSQEMCTSPKTLLKMYAQNHPVIQSNDQGS